MIWKRFEREQQAVITVDKQIEEIDVRARITLRDGNHHGEVRFDECLTRGFRFLVVGEHVPAEVDLLCGTQLWNGPNKAQINLDRILIEFRRVHAASVALASEAECGRVFHVSANTIERAVRKLECHKRVRRERTLELAGRGR